MKEVSNRPTSTARARQLARLAWGREKILSRQHPNFPIASNDPGCCMNRPQRSLPPQSSCVRLANNSIMDGRNNPAIAYLRGLPHGFTRLKPIIANRSSQKPGYSDLRGCHRLLYSQGFNMSPFVNNSFHSFSPRGLRLVFWNSKRAKWVLLWSCIRGAKISLRRGAKSTYGRFVFKSERSHERLKLLDVCKATGHLGNPEFATGSRGVSGGVLGCSEIRPDTYPGRRILHASRMQFGQFVPMRLRAQTTTLTIWACPWVGFSPSSLSTSDPGRGMRSKISASVTKA
jgi:hypothetical protein